MKGTATVPNSKLIKFNMRHKMRSGEKLNSVYANWIVQSAIKTRDLYTVITKSRKNGAVRVSRQ